MLIIATRERGMCEFSLYLSVLAECKPRMTWMTPRITRMPLVAMMQIENMDPVTAPLSAQGVSLDGAFKKHLLPLAEDDGLDEVM